MKKGLLLALPLFLFGFTFAQIENDYTGDILTGDVSTLTIISGDVKTGAVKCYKEVWSGIVYEYKTKRENINLQKTEIKNQIRTLMIERKNTKDRTKKSEISNEIDSLEWQIWKLNEEYVISYKTEYVAKFYAKKNEPKECKLQKK